MRPALIDWSKTVVGEVATDSVTVNVLLQGRIQTQRVEELDAAAASRSARGIEEIATDPAAAIPAARPTDPSYGSSPAQRAVLRIWVSISCFARNPSLALRAAMILRCSPIDSRMRSGSVIGIGCRCVSVT